MPDDTVAGTVCRVRREEKRLPGPPPAKPRGWGKCSLPQADKRQGRPPTGNVSANIECSGEAGQSMTVFESGFGRQEKGPAQHQEAKEVPL